MIALLFALMLGQAQAHEVRPAFLGLTEVGEATYDVSWKRPMRGDRVLKLQPVFPPDCQDVSRSTEWSGGAQIDRAVIRCEQSLAGRTLAIDRLDAVPVDTIVQTHVEGIRQHELLRGGHNTVVVAEPTPPLQALADYIGLGVVHILIGIDHLLFVLGLLAVVAGRRQLVGAITAFTVAHSLTLGAATLNLIHVPQAPVEAVIAASIALLAVEMMSDRPTMTRKRPWLVAFAVGLLHGLGFSGALAEVGLPQGQVPLALFGFNLGVELGQLAFVAVVLAVGFVAQKAAPIPPMARRVAAYAMGSIAGFWVIERTVAFL